MPEEFGKYLLLDRINQGGMAEVYLARASGFGGADQLIALKRIRPEVSADPAFVEMFVHEAKLSVMLSHPNIAQIFDLGKTGEHYYIAMEYLSGRDLRAVLDRANREGIELPEHLILHMLSQVLEGLDYAHRKADPAGKALDIVHRDISPHNVVISYTGDVKLIDFGIAKAATETDQSQSGVLKGKYGYMAPEQVLGKSVDSRTDIFATGVLLYELLTQKRLFEGASDFSILEKVRYAEVYPPSTLSPRIPLDVEDVVLKALCADPDARFQSAADMQEAVVSVMLANYGHPTPREIANLMKALFAQEIKDDLKTIEQARVSSLLESGEEPVLDGPTEEMATVPAGAAEARRDASDTDPGTGQAIADDEDDEDFVPREKTVPDIVPDELNQTLDTGLDATLDAAADTEEVPIVGPSTRRSKVSPIPRPSRSAVEANAAQFQPTEVRSAFRKGGARDTIIVISALMLAAALVLVSWIATRGEPWGSTARISVLTVPPGAEVWLDEEIVGRTPYHQEVGRGLHKLTLSHEGYVSETRMIKVADRQLNVQLILKPAPVP